MSFWRRRLDEDNARRLADVAEAKWSTGVRITLDAAWPLDRWRTVLAQAERQGVFEQMAFAPRIPGRKVGEALLEHRLDELGL